MPQDLEAGKAVDLDALLSALQELGQQLESVPTLSGDAVLALVKQIKCSLDNYLAFP